VKRCDSEENEDNEELGEKKNKESGKKALNTQH
jgi:hypothetical protein